VRLTQPRPLALERCRPDPSLSLDDAPLEERRTQAVMARRWRGPAGRARPSAGLDPHAIAKVQSEACPIQVNSDELHDRAALLACRPK